MKRFRRRLAPVAPYVPAGAVILAALLGTAMLRADRPDTNPTGWALISEATR